MGDERVRLVGRGYDRIAEIYEQWNLGTASAKSRYLEVFEDRVARGSEVLDLGCGTGAQVTRVLARHHRVVGVDVSPRSVAIARSRIDDVEFVVADIASVAFAEQSFDGVVAFFSLIHVPRERDAAVLASIWSWLRPGGWFVGTMSSGPGGEGIEDFLGVAMYWSGWSTATNIALVEAAGFVNITATEVPEREDDRVVTHLWIVAQRPPGDEPVVT
jgi:ubiquinone/menaquinone biosynthesis C-methylase UbiE